MNRNAGGHQFGLPWRQCDGAIDAGAQVEAGRAGRGVLRQLSAQARVKNFDVEFFHDVINSQRSMGMRSIQARCVAAR